MICEEPDFIFPMQADVYYPIVDQGVYGNVKKTWVLDKTIAGNFNSVGGAGKEEITPNVNITQNSSSCWKNKDQISEYLQV